jgi:hypothetical protein
MKLTVEKPANGIKQLFDVRPGVSRTIIPANRTPVRQGLSVADGVLFPWSITEPSTAAQQ